MNSSEPGVWSNTGKPASARGVQPICRAYSKSRFSTNPHNKTISRLNKGTSFTSLQIRSRFSFFIFFLLSPFSPASHKYVRTNQKIMDSSASHLRNRKLDVTKDYKKMKEKVEVGPPKNPSWPYPTLTLSKVKLSLWLDLFKLYNFYRKHFL